MSEQQRIKREQQRLKQQEKEERKWVQPTPRGRKRQVEPVMEKYSPPYQDIEEIPEASGKGYHGGNLDVFDNLDACGKNIFDDVSRLEVLVGGRRAGNNSPEVINEATGICQRLSQNGIIDASIYRRLINEIIDDYYSD